MLSPLGAAGGVLSPLGLSRGGAADWWAVPGQTCVAAYKPIGAASLAASYVNLANPGMYDAAPGVAPTLGAGGWVFDGTKYLNTGLVAGSGWSAVAKFSGASGNNGTLVGSYTGAGNLFIMAPRNNSATNALWRYGNSEKSAVPARSSGVMALAGPTGYFDGVEIANAIGTWGGTPTRPIWIGASNQGSVVAPLTGTIAAVAIYSTTLSADDNMELKIRMAALT